MFNTSSLAGETVVDVDIQREGCRLVGRDVYSNGEQGVIKSDLGSYKTPEHADAMLLLMNRPDFFLLAATITDEQIDKLAAEILKRKNNAHVRNPDCPC